MNKTIILYPRVYNTRGEPHQHNVVGITSENEIVKIRLDNNSEKYSIYEFSKTSFTANQPCQADESNGPNNPMGILLLFNCQKKGNDPKQKIPVYDAKYGVVLSSHENDNKPIFGIGRIEINKKSKVMRELHEKKRIALDEENYEYAEEIEKEKNNPENWGFNAIYYFPKELTEVKETDTSHIERTISDFINRYGKKGKIAGVLVRGLSKERKVIKESCFEAFSKFIVKEKRYQNGEEASESIINDLFRKSDPKISIWHIIPIMRIYGGSSLSPYYGSPKRISIIRDNFTGKNDLDPRVCQICSKARYQHDFDITFMNRTFSISATLGDPARMDENGHCSYSFTGESVKEAHLKVEPKEIKLISSKTVNENEQEINRGFKLRLGKDSNKNDEEKIPEESKDRTKKIHNDQGEKTNSPGVDQANNESHKTKTNEKETAGCSGDVEVSLESQKGETEATLELEATETINEAPKEMVQMEKPEHLKKSEQREEVEETRGVEGKESDYKKEQEETESVNPEENEEPEETGEPAESSETGGLEDQLEAEWSKKPGTGVETKEGQDKSELKKKGEPEESVETKESIDKPNKENKKEEIAHKKESEQESGRKSTKKEKAPQKGSMASFIKSKKAQ